MEGDGGVKCNRGRAGWKREHKENLKSASSVASLPWRGKKIGRVEHSVARFILFFAISYLLQVVAATSAGKRHTKIYNRNLLHCVILLRIFMPFLSFFPLLLLHSFCAFGQKFHRNHQKHTHKCNPLLTLHSDNIANLCTSITKHMHLGTREELRFPSFDNVSWDGI